MTFKKTCTKGGFPRNIYIHAYICTNVYMTFKKTCTKGGFPRVATVKRLVVAESEQGRRVMEFFSMLST